jgi:hypothetical protein
MKAVRFQWLMNSKCIRIWRENKSVNAAGGASGFVEWNMSRL